MSEPGKLYAATFTPALLLALKRGLKPLVEAQKGDLILCGDGTLWQKLKQGHPGRWLCSLGFASLTGTSTQSSAAEVRINATVSIASGPVSGEAIEAETLRLVGLTEMVVAWVLSCRFMDQTSGEPHDFADGTRGMRLVQAVPLSLDGIAGAIAMRATFRQAIGEPACLEPIQCPVP